MYDSAGYDHSWKTFSTYLYFGFDLSAALQHPDELPSDMRMYSA